jgi:hypothetical protein
VPGKCGGQGADLIRREVVPYRARCLRGVSLWMGHVGTERARASLDSLPQRDRPAEKRESPQSTAA